MMVLTEEIKKQKTEAIQKSLNDILEGRPYIALISILEDYSAHEGRMNAITWGIKQVGNADLAKDPFLKINVLINSLVSLFEESMKSLVAKKGEKA